MKRGAGIKSADSLFLAQMAGRACHFPPISRASSSASFDFTTTSPLAALCVRMPSHSGENAALHHWRVLVPRAAQKSSMTARPTARESSGNVKKCAVGKYPKSEKHGNTAQFSEVERSGTQENCGGIGSGCRLRLRPLPVLHRRQSQRVARIDPNAVVVDKNIAENDRFDLFSR